MQIKRCNHCQLVVGQYMELSTGGTTATCINCGCVWDLDGVHLLAGKAIKPGDKDCIYPQHQQWSNNPIVQQ